MQKRNIGFALFLIFVGLVLILINFGIIGLSVVGSLITLWPLIIIVIGINIIFRQYPIVKALVWIAFLATLIIYAHYFPEKGDFLEMLRNHGYIIDNFRGRV